MSEKEQTFNINITLDGELAKKFKKIKEDLGFKWNTNVVRYLVAVRYEKVFGSGRYLVPFTEKEVNALQKVSQKVGMTPQQIVEEAVREYIEERGYKVPA